MHRLCLCFLLAYGGTVAAEDSAGIVWLGIDKAKCGGILIEPDVVISARSCIKNSFEVLWPFKSGIIAPRYEDKNAGLVVLFLERSWPNTTRLIHTSELSHLKKGLSVIFSNREHSVKNWIDDLGPLTITAFHGLEQPLIGSPMWSDFGVIGMITGEKTALRLDPYFAFVAAAIKTGREKRPKIPATNTTTTIVIEAQHVKIEQPTQSEASPSVIPGMTRDTWIQHPASAEASAGKQVRNDSPPESLGCSCSQVRRRSGVHWSGRFSRFFRRFFL